MPSLLLLDTSSQVTTVAISHKGKVVCNLRHHDARGQGAMLNIWIEQAMKDSGLSLSELDGIGICAGPGSYTGLRIGLSTAKGIAFALDKKIMLFDRLHLIAASFEGDRGTEGKMVVLKARADEYFMAKFGKGDKVVLMPRHVFLREFPLLELTGKTFLITDDGQFPISADVVLPEAFEIDVAAWSAIALERALGDDWDELEYSEPYYLKAAHTTQRKKKLIN